MSDIFENKSKTLPKNDSRVERIDMDKSDLGARKSHVRGNATRNENSIRHVGSKG